MLPAPINNETGLTPLQAAKARRAQAGAGLAVFRYALQAQARAEMDRIDSQATADAVRAALEAELDLLDFGMARAGRSAARLELVSRKVDLQSATNNQRLRRHFGS